MNLSKEKTESKALTAAQRKRNERARKRALGLTEIRFWVHPDDREAVKKAAEMANKKANKLL